MNKKSFTLIELLVVIAIIGILSSLVIARFSDWGDNARIANTLQWSSGVHRLLGSSLLAHWKMDECDGTVVSDISGYGNQGDIIGTVPFQTDTPSGEGCSLYFDGTSSVNCVETNFNWNYLQEMTISIWFKSNDILTRGIVGSRFWTGSGNRGRMFYRNSSDPDGLWRWYIIYTNTNDEYSSLASLYNGLSMGKWHHSVLVIHPNGDGAIYLEGIKHNDWATPANFKNWNSAKGGAEGDDLPFAIGRAGGVGYTSLSFFGSIDDVRIYDTALTAEEISRIYAESKDSYLAYE